MARAPVVGPKTPTATSATRARTPKAPQTKKYGATNIAVATVSAGLTGRPPSRRVIPWNATIMGSAAGSIIATIIVVVNPKKSASSRGCVGAPTMRKDIVNVDVENVTYQAIDTKIATRHATETVTRRSTSGADMDPSTAKVRGHVRERICTRVTASDEPLRHVQIDNLC